ncbi:hypothetical protein Nepgr_015894 [Nepenthes gracilis]|uniref:Reverse transcriptase Ty1/copia-type domain-containing protein n=1 Tax=Nepenthes gracilis TaxID=150966 RepID=A0AAD3XR46_NEPGR|nr:hypothetical protein Nepgr_015894 [Nepenthes gracilis]
MRIIPLISLHFPRGRRHSRTSGSSYENDENTKEPRYKDRLVVKGFGQRKGIDFDEIFAPVVKMSSIRVVLGLAATQDLEVEQMDVQTVFLH